MPPIYDYECSACKTRTQVLRRLSQSDMPPVDDELECDCGVPQERLIGVPSIVKSASWGAKGSW